MTCNFFTLSNQLLSSAMSQAVNTLVAQHQLNCWENISSDSSSVFFFPLHLLSDMIHLSCVTCRPRPRFSFCSNSFNHFAAAETKRLIRQSHPPSWPGRTGPVRWECGCGRPAPGRQVHAPPSIGSLCGGHLCPELRLTQWACWHDGGPGRLRRGGEPAAAPRT